MPDKDNFPVTTIVSKMLHEFYKDPYNFAKTEKEDTSGQKPKGEIAKTFFENSQGRN